MNLWAKDSLPRAIVVNGAEHPINTDFRLGIQFEILTHGHEASRRTRTIQQLLLYYGENIPDDIAAAYKALLAFVNGAEEGRGKKRGDNDVRVIDYEGDAKLIYAAFLDQYGVDLDEADLHWWKFRAMLAGLREDHRISKIMGYRAMKTGSIKNKEYRKHVAEMKRLHAIKPKHGREDLVEMASQAFG